MPRKGHFLVTGGAGFIGSSLIEWLFADHEVEQVTLLDKFTYAGEMRHIEHHVKGGSLKVVNGDVANEEIVEELISECPEGVFHLAAESHVDRSIAGPKKFILPNILGAVNVMDACRRYHVRCLMVSTDEVYGDSDELGGFNEEMLFDASSPYSWSKSCADAYRTVLRRTYAADEPQILVSRGCNHIGPRQQWEKFVPRVIAAAIEGTPIGLYGDGRQIRTWIDVRDGARALYHIMKHGKVGEAYNLGPNEQCSILTNEDLARKLYSLVTGEGGEKAPIKYIADRPGHDRAYLMNVSKLYALEPNWRPLFGLELTLRNTVEWYKQPENFAWLKECRARDDKFKRKNYDERGQR